MQKEKEKRKGKERRQSERTDLMSASRTSKLFPFFLIQSNNGFSKYNSALVTYREVTIRRQEIIRFFFDLFPFFSFW